MNHANADQSMIDTFFIHMLREWEYLKKKNHRILYNYIELLVQMHCFNISEGCKAWRSPWMNNRITSEKML